MIDNLIILCLIVLSFVAGMKVSEHYRRREKQNIDYEVRLACARIKANDYSVYVPFRPIGQDFMDKLHEEGRATQQLPSPKQCKRRAGAPQYPGAR